MISKSQYRRMAAQRQDAYDCYDCKTRHTTENMVAYCAVCVDRISKGIRSDFSNAMKLAGIGGLMRVRVLGRLR